MKKFVNYGLSLMLIASLFLVSSCGETEPVEPEFAAPSLTITGGDEGNETTVDVGQAVSFKVNVTAPAGFNTFFHNKTVDGVTTSRIDEKSRPAGTTATTFDYEFTYTPAEVEAGKEVIIDFVAVDDKGKENSVEYIINVNESAPVKEYETVLLGGQLNKTEKSFFNALGGQKLGYSEANSAPAKVDFLYYYQKTTDGGGTHATIGAPADEPTRTFWKNTKNEAGVSLALSEQMKNATSFKRMPANYDYATITNDNQLANAYLETSGASDAGTRITNLEVGQSFAFKLDAGRGGSYGLIQVAKIEGTDGSNRTITLKVKVQSEDN